MVSRTSHAGTDPPYRYVARTPEEFSDVVLESVVSDGCVPEMKRISARGRVSFPAAIGIPCATGSMLVFPGLLRDAGTWPVQCCGMWSQFATTSDPVWAGAMQRYRL